MYEQIRNMHLFPQVVGMRKAVPGKGIGLNVQNGGGGGVLGHTCVLHGRWTDWQVWVTFAGEMTQMRSRCCARQWILAVKNRGNLGRKATARTGLVRLVYHCV